MLNYDKDPIKYPVIYDNKLNITNFDELYSKEASLVAARQIEISYKNLFVKGIFDLSKLQVIHKFLFQDIYPWAGKLRDGDISKNGSAFCHYLYIESSMQHFYDKKMKNFDADGNKNCVAEHLAYVANELNVLHPFREGNGRSKRVFLYLYAQSLGYQFNMQNIPPKQLIQMDIQAFATDDISNMANIFYDNLEKIK